MATHIIQLTDEYESYLQEHFGTLNPPFKTLSSYIECLVAKDMAENGITPHSSMAGILSSPEVLDDLKARYQDRSVQLKESQSLKSVSVLGNAAA